PSPLRPNFLVWLPDHGPLPLKPLVFESLWIATISQVVDQLHHDILPLRHASKLQSLKRSVPVPHDRSWAAHAALGQLPVAVPPCPKKYLQNHERSLYLRPRTVLTEEFLSAHWYQRLEPAGVNRLLRGFERCILIHAVRQLL